MHGTRSGGTHEVSPLGAGDAHDVHGRAGGVAGVRRLQRQKADRLYARWSDGERLLQGGGRSRQWHHPRGLSGLRRDLQAGQPGRRHLEHFAWPIGLHLHGRGAGDCLCARRHEAVMLLHNGLVVHSLMTKDWADRNGITSFADIAAKKPQMRLHVNQLANLQSTIAMYVALFDAYGIKEEEVTRGLPCSAATRPAASMRCATARS